MSRSHRRWGGCAACIAAVSIVAGFGGCATDPNGGYAFASTHDMTVDSVYVPMFYNETFTHGIESQLTDSIIKQLKVATPWKVTSESTAQTTLTGRITGSRLSALSIGRVSGMVQEQAVILTIEFEWRDNRTQKVLVRRKNFTASEIFVPSQGVGERLDAGQDGAIQKLARNVVEELRTAW